jgi:hypothetical protein
MRRVRLRGGFLAILSAGALTSAATKISTSRLRSSSTARTAPRWSSPTPGRPLCDGVSECQERHIVPRAYLKNWAVDGEIAVWLVPENLRLPDQPIENVGTRRRFYRRQRPDGTEIDDIEWTLSETESKAGPFLGSLDERWPMLGEDKLYLATRFAFQLLRGAALEGRV